MPRSRFKEDSKLNQGQGVARFPGGISQNARVVEQL